MTKDEPTTRPPDHPIIQPTNLDPIFRPRSVAVVGASNDPYKWGYLLLDNVLQGEYAGPVYPVNPRETRIHDLPACPRLTDVPGPVDLAIVAVPAPAVPSVMADAADASVRAALIITSGLDDDQTQATLAEARRGGVRVVGPNCMGLHSYPARLSALMIPASLEPGPIAFISQSGGYGVQLFILAQRQRLGIRTFVSSGAEADLTSTDYLAYFGADPEVRAIVMYLEGLHPGEGDRFIQVARRVTQEKPVVVKLGAASAGERDTAYDAAFRQAGVLRAHDPAQLFDYARALSRLPLPRGRRVGILTRSGGAGAEAAAHCAQRGLEVPPLRPETEARLRELLPPYAGVSNPVDITSLLDPGPFNEALHLMLEQDDVDALIALGIVQMSPEELGERYTWISAIYNGLLEANLVSLVGQFRRTGKPIVVESATGISGRNQRLLDEIGVPVYPIPGRAVDAVAALTETRELREHVRAWEPRVRRPSLPQSEAAGFLHVLREQGRRALTEAEAKSVLRTYGVPVAEGTVVQSAAEAVDVAREYGFPVVIKVVSADIVHKTAVGGVKVGVRSPAAVRRAYEELLENAELNAPEATVEGVLVQRMAAAGREMLVGLVRDARFGPVVTVGLGGVLAEALGDTALGVAPLTTDEARRMIARLRAYPMLAGAHGEEPADVETLMRVILAVSDLAVDCPAIAALDINPFFLYDRGHGGVAVDAFIALA